VPAPVVLSNKQLKQKVELPSVSKTAFEQNKQPMERAAASAMLATLRAHALEETSVGIRAKHVVAMASWVAGRRRRLSGTIAMRMGRAGNIEGSGSKFDSKGVGTVGEMEGRRIGRQGLVGVGGRGLVADMGVVTIEVTVSGLPAVELAAVEATMAQMAADTEGAGAGGTSSGTLQSFQSGLVQQIRAEGLSSAIQTAAADASVKQPEQVDLGELLLLRADPSPAENDNCDDVECKVLVITAVFIGVLLLVGFLAVYLKGWQRAEVHSCCKADEPKGGGDASSAKAEKPVALERLEAKFGFDSRREKLPPVGGLALPSPQDAISTKVPPI
jgi:hypothetical protein